MKLIVRADDLGISEAVNLGIEKSIKDGIVRSVGLMPNMEAAAHGVQRIQEYEHVCIGQHTNLCLGTPLCNPCDIPSLVNQSTGQFCSSKEIRARSEDSICVEEAMLEIEAQYHQFVKLTGRQPAYFEGHAIFSKNFFIALAKVAKKYDLFYVNPMDKQWSKETGIQMGKWFEADANGLYDPISYMIDDQCDIADKTCAVLIFHPGYLDQFILEHSSFTLIRPLETAALCSEQVKEWVKDNHIELCNFANYNR